MARRRIQSLPTCAELGLGAVDLPSLPAPPRRPRAPLHLADYELPDDVYRIIDYIQGPGLALLHQIVERRGHANVWALGLGIKRVRGEKTGEFAAQFLVQQKLPASRVPKGCVLPRSVGDGIPTDVLQIDRTIHALQRPCPGATGIPSACAGAAVTETPVQNGGGTLSGSWPSLTSSGDTRGMVSAHVALGFGFFDFLAALPGSIARLFTPPRGQEIFTNSLGAPGNFRIMEIDSPWPILAPAAFALPGLPAGAAAFFYVDSAAGRLDFEPLPVPPPLPPGPAPPPQPVRGGIVGPPARIRSARAPLPGTAVYKIGATTFRTWGEISLSFLVVPIAVGPFTILFDQVVCDLTIAPGDSGAPVLTSAAPGQTVNRFIGQAWGGLPPVVAGPGPLLLGRTLATPAHQIWWRLDLDMF